MLNIAQRLLIPTSRFPPIPFVDPPPRRISEAERRLIRAALALGTPELPTDWPDLSPLIEALENVASAQVNAA